MKRLLKLILTCVLVLSLTLMNTGVTFASSDLSKTLIFGDSRTKLMSYHVTGKLVKKGLYKSETNDVKYWLYKSGSGFDYFYGQLNNITKLVKKGKVKNIIIWYGVNDAMRTSCDSDFVASLYATELNRLAKGDWKNCNIYYASVGYIDTYKVHKVYTKNGVYTWDNSNRWIENFNISLQTQLDSSIKFIDINSVVTEKTGISSVDTTERTQSDDKFWMKNKNHGNRHDGLHYTKSISKAIYDKMISQL